MFIKSIYFLFLFKASSHKLPSNKLPMIRNTQYPICSNCIHFIEHKTNYPYEDVPDDERYAKCKKFGEVSLIVGIINYDSARICRSDEKKCGISGSFFEEKPKS